MTPHRLLAAGGLSLGLLTASLLAEPLSGGRFSLDGGPVTGGGQSGGGTFAVAGAPGEAATGPLSGGSFQVTGGLIGVAVIPGNFALNIGSAPDGQVRIDWAAGAAGYVLEFTPSVGEFANWQPVTPAPAGNSFITSANQPLRFYRLHRP
jgi:hypothetical protein